MQNEEITIWPFVLINESEYKASAFTMVTSHAGETHSEKHVHHICMSICFQLYLSLLNVIFTIYEVISGEEIIDCSRIKISYCWEWNSENSVCCIASLLQNPLPLSTQSKQLSVYNNQSSFNPHVYLC